MFQPDSGSQFPPEIDPQKSLLPVEFRFAGIACIPDASLIMLTQGLP